MLRSLLARIVLFSASILTLVLVLFLCANQYAAARLRAQAVQAQETLLGLHVEQMDESLEALRLSMVQRAHGDLSLNALSFYDPEGDDYKLCAQECKRQLKESLLINRLPASQYLYCARTEMLLSASPALESARHLYIGQHLPFFLQDTGVAGSPAWALVLTAGYLSDGRASGWVLVKTLKVSDTVTLGAAVGAQDLIRPLEGALPCEGAIVRAYSQEGVLLGELPAGAPGRAGFDAAVSAALAKGDAPFRVQDPQEGKGYIGIPKAMETAPVTVVTLLPEDEVLRQLVLFRRIGTALPIALLLTILAAVAVLPSLYRPFDQLIRIMEGVAAGDLSLRLPPGRTPEFVQVNLRFNEMVARLDQLQKDLLRQSEMAHKAELMHLQAQINPHFYQNTLNLIYNLAALKQYELIQKTALHLAEYFRFIMRSGDQPIALREELNHIAHYMELQKIRYPRAIQYVQEAEADVLDLPILPLLLQPFVENSVIHGFTTKRAFLVSVRARRAEGAWVEIEIEDNGSGMAAETVMELNRIATGQGGRDDRHIGVWNAATRLRRFYGEGAALHFETGRAWGTLVRIRIPTVQQ